MITQVKISKVKINNIYMFKHQTINLEDMNIIVGINGCGKSTLLKIINSMILIANGNNPASQTYLEQGSSSDSYCELTIVIDKNHWIFKYLMLHCIIQNNRVNGQIKWNLNEIDTHIHEYYRKIIIRFEPYTSNLMINNKISHVFFSSIGDMYRIFIDVKDSTSNMVDRDLLTDTKLTIDNRDFPTDTDIFVKILDLNNKLINFNECFEIWVAAIMKIGQTDILDLMYPRISTEKYEILNNYIQIMYRNSDQKICIPQIK